MALHKPKNSVTLAGLILKSHREFLLISGLAFVVLLVVLILYPWLSATWEAFAEFINIAYRAFGK